MPEEFSLRSILFHPWTTASAVFAAVGGILKIPILGALWTVAWNQAGALFTAASVTATTLAPEVPWLPQEQLIIAALLTGALFVATKASSVWDALADRLGGDSS